MQELVDGVRTSTRGIDVAIVKATLAGRWRRRSVFPLLTQKSARGPSSWPPAHAWLSRQGSLTRRIAQSPLIFCHELTPKAATARLGPEYSFPREIEKMVAGMEPGCCGPPKYPAPTFY